MAKKKPIIQFVICLIIFLACVAICILRLDLLKKPIFHSKTEFVTAGTAKYERDGNIYVIDDGLLRIVCMTPEGKINYTIHINKNQEYAKFCDLVLDESGNLYVYIVEMAYDAIQTKQDIIRKYDAQGHFVKDIFSSVYASDESNPRTFPQFGSLRCENGILTFSRVQKDHVKLYRYNIIRDELASSIFSWDVSDYSVSRLMLRDFNNFIYTTRDGNIYEVRDSVPILRASFTFTEEGGGGIIPWYPNYDEAGNIVFFDMISSNIFRITPDGAVQPAVPPKLLDQFRQEGIFSTLTGFGFFREHFAGVFGDIVWYYDGNELVTYRNGITLSEVDWLQIITVQISFLLGIGTFLLGLYLLFVRILNRYVSLFIKQTVLLIPITAAGFVILYSSTSSFMDKRLVHELLNDLLFKTVLSAKLINGDDLYYMRSTADFRSPAYKKLLETLQDITGNNTEEWNKLYYAAVYKVLGDNEYCIAFSNEEMNIFRPYGSISVEEGTGEYELVMHGRPFANILELSDSTWAYANAPLYTSSGQFAGIFEIGTDMTSYQIANAIQRREAMMIAVLTGLVILLISAIIMFLIIKQLSSVAQVLAAIAKGNCSARVQYRARDELGLVSRGLNLMAEELQRQIEKIVSLSESSLRFVPVQFMKYLGVEDITKMKLGDHVQRPFTILFFDIRAFSINSEMMSAKENFLFINKIMGFAGPILRKYHGFVDKYIGDAAMVLFANALDAVRAGIELYRVLVLNKKTKIKVGADGINISVGVNSGSVMMGIVGENERLASTVISPNVNLASRVESLTRQTKSGMLITRNTLNEISGHEGEFKSRFIGMIQAAGVNEVIGLFDILDALPDNIREKRLKTKKVFESGIRKYHTKEYAAAYRRFAWVIKMDPNDVCAANCLAETKRRLKDPSLPSVFIFSRK
jgi:class 3 adenylate cyclase/HAMP domain-containing protein